jgi:hypothetical protein
MVDLLHSALDRARAIGALATPAERRIALFLVGWALVGALASRLPLHASFASDGRARVTIPAGDPRSPLHARSAALAAHLAIASTPPETPLDPNRASSADLDRLPGVGPRTALRWAAVRDSDGPFLALPDLARVKGLGPSKLKRLATPPETAASVRRTGAWSTRTARAHASWMRCRASDLRSRLASWSIAERMDDSAGPSTWTASRGSDRPCCGS